MRLILIFTLSFFCFTDVLSQDIFLIGNINSDSISVLTKLVEETATRTSSKKIRLAHIDMEYENNELPIYDTRKEDWMASLRSDVKQICKRTFPIPNDDAIEAARKKLKKRYEKEERIVMIFDKTEPQNADGKLYFSDWEDFLGKISKKPKCVYLVNFTVQIPSVKITAPQSRVYKSDFILSGTSTCNIGKVDTTLIKLNDENWVVADGAPGNWTKSLDFKQGNNTIQVKAIGSFKASSIESVNVVYEAVNGLPIRIVYPQKDDNLHQCNHGGDAFNFRFKADKDLRHLIEDGQVELKIEDSINRPFNLITVGDYQNSDYEVSDGGMYCLFVSVSTLFPGKDNEGNITGGCIDPTEKFYYYFRTRDRNISTPKTLFHFTSSRIGECACE